MTTVEGVEDRDAAPEPLPPAGQTTTANEQAGADDPARLARYKGAPVPRPRPQGHFLLRFWRSAVGKKWVMAVSGIVLLVYVLAHLVGTLKVFIGREEINHYAEWLRTLGEPLFPFSFVLWAMRTVLVAALFLHVVAAYQLTRMNWRARPARYQSRRDYVAANFASRTMRWTGVIVGLFLIYHLLDQTWGPANPAFVRGDPYMNMFYSFDRVPVAIVYIVANIALGIHVWHGAWAMFNSLGINNPRYNAWKRDLATVFALAITVGYVSMPLLIVTGAVSP